MTFVDLRSDTATRPTPEMREAIVGSGAELTGQSWVSLQRLGVMKANSGRAPARRSLARWPLVAVPIGTSQRAQSAAIGV